jgi:hypothetical protein
MSVIDAKQQPHGHLRCCSMSAAEVLVERRLIHALAVIALALLPFAASAQSTVTGSGFQVQNLSEATAANIVITYYNGDGTTAATQSATILAGGSLTFFDGNGGTVAMSAPAGFRGSVVISSDQPIAAITNLIGANLGESYGGFSSGGQTASVPLVVRGNFSSTTTITVQNTGASATTATIAYTPTIAGNTGVTESKVIPPGASVTFSQNDTPALGARFVGSATITAGPGGSIVAVVSQENGTQLLVYNAFNAGGTTIAVPLLVANNFGGLTGLQIQNNGSAAANVTVTYTPNTVTTPGTATSVCTTPGVKTFSLAAGFAKTLIQAGGAEEEGFDSFFATCRYVGGATITADQPLVAIVNQISGASASSYESFDTASATSTVKVPLAMANNFGIFTGIQVQNVGSAATTVTVTYGANTISGAGACGALTPATANVAAGGSFTFIQSGGGAASDGFDAQFATCRFVGSATITASSGGKIVAIVNQAAGGPGDGLFTYNAFNQ